MAEIIEIINPLTCLPEKVVKYSSSAQQIDDAVDFVDTEKTLRSYRKIEIKSVYDIALSGFISGTSKEIVLTMPFTDMIGKPKINISGGIIGRYHGGYFPDAPDSSPFTDISVDSYRNGDIITMKIKKADGSAWEIENNIPVSIAFSVGTIIEISCE